MFGTFWSIYRTRVILYAINTNKIVSIKSNFVCCTRLHHAICGMRWTLFSLRTWFRAQYGIQWQWPPSPRWRAAFPSCTGTVSIPYCLKKGQTVCSTCHTLLGSRGHAVLHEGRAKYQASAAGLVFVCLFELFACLFVSSFVCLFVCLFVCFFCVKYPLFSHTYSVILCTLHVILPSTLMYFGSRHGSLW